MENKYLERKIRACSNAVFRELTRERRLVRSALYELAADKSANVKAPGAPLTSPIDVLLDSFPTLIPEILAERASQVMERAAEFMADKHQAETPGFEIDFSVPTRPEAEYIQALTTLHLSQRAGSITKTTVDRIRALIVEGVSQGMTYRQVADNISQLDPLVFSRNRAEIIAVNQMGKAYQYGEYLPMKYAQDSGYTVEKFWATVNDDRVTATHRINQADGYVPLDQPFSGTGDQLPPGSDNPRCRCALAYRLTTP